VHISNLKLQEHADDLRENGDTSGLQNGPRVGWFKHIKKKISRSR